MNPQKLMLAVKAAYASFDSYSDKGVCTPELPSLPSARPFNFQTYYKRPSKFRFCWATYHPFFGDSGPPLEFALWTDGTHFNHHLLGTTREAESLSILIATMTGVSSTSVNQISSILIPSSSCLKFHWHEMTDLQLRQNETVQDVECSLLSGTSKTPDDTEVWIDIKTLQIRRLRQKKVTTEEDANKINEYTQSQNHIDKIVEGLKGKGLPDEAIDEALRIKKMHRMLPTTSYYTFDYLEVGANDPVDESLFKHL